MNTPEFRPGGRRGAMSIAKMAEHLGLSEGTVSRALNDYPDIAEKTRERVQNAAREMGYSPSSTARRLATGVIETIGFVLPAREGHVTDPFLAELLDGIASELAVHDWDLLVAAVPDGQDELDVMERLVRTGKVGGFVLTRVRREDPRVDLLLEQNVPFVVHGRTGNAENYSWIDVDNRKAFVDATHYLNNLGHERIAHLAGDVDFNFAYERREGYLQALEDIGLELREGYLVDCVTDALEADEAMTQLLALCCPPTAVVCVTDNVALGAMRAVRRAGLRIGRDISIIGYDGLPIGEAADPPLTTMSQSSHLAGEEAARLVRRQVQAKSRKMTGKKAEAHSQILWEARLTQRGTTNPPPEKAQGKPHTHSKAG